MRVCIELLEGPFHLQRTPTKQHMELNINAVKRAIEGRPLSIAEKNQLSNTVSILEALQKELPLGGPGTLYGNY